MKYTAFDVIRALLAMPILFIAGVFLFLSLWIGGPVIVTGVSMGLQRDKT